MKNKDLGEINKKNIAKVAMQVMYEHGIDNTTKDMIANNTEFAKITIERHFRTKSDLVFAAVMECIEEQNSLFFDKFDVLFKGLTGKEMLIKFFDEMYEHIIKYPKSFVLQAEALCYFYRTNDFERKDTLAKSAPFRIMLDKILETGKEDGTIKLEWSIRNEGIYTCDRIFGFLTIFFYQAMGIEGFEPEARIIFRKLLDDSLSRYIK